MKRFYFPKKCVLAVAVVAMLAAACGLEISKVEFSTHEPEQNSTMTITTSFVTTDTDPTDDWNHNPQADYYLLYAVRVPNDWSGEGLYAYVVEKTEDNSSVVGEGEVAMVDCQEYAKFCEFCFPLDGYKWVAWRSNEKCHQGSHDEATVTLKVGEAMGSYTLDIMTGGWQYDLSELLTESGDINLNVAFGCNLNRSEFSEHKEKIDGQDVAVYFNTSEYLFNSSTISEAEYKSRIEAMKSTLSATVTVEKDGKVDTKTLPVAPDIANLAKDMDMSVTVKEGAGIEGVAIDAAEGAAEYFDLQGRRVANPEAGLYLVKRGGKVAKEIVK